MQKKGKQNKILLRKDIDLISILIIELSILNCKDYLCLFYQKTKLENF